MAADSSFTPPGELGTIVLDKLMREGVVSNQDIEQARKISENANTSLLLTLNQIGILSDDRLAKSAASVAGLPLFDPDIDSLSDTIVTPLNADFQKAARCLLMNENGPLLVVDPFDERLLRAIEFTLGEIPPRQIIRHGDWQRLFEHFHPADTASPLSSGLRDEDEFALELADQSRDAPIVRQVSTWLSDAADLGASDVHFDAKRNALEVLYRQDGNLKTVSTQPKSSAAGIMTRIKVIANLDLGEQNKAQDGRATIVVRGRRLDVRISIIPTIDGESAVIRLLDRQDGLLNLDGLGFDEDIKAELRSVIERRHGMFVVAGPTGSGKTTTLYACIEQLKGRGLKILSVEDPVEYHFDHVSQVQISEKAGRTFASALRSFLRHDPDVILVGEIRDEDTAIVAVQAALSGHLVLATLHAIDSSRIRTRLIDMGIEPFKLDACLVGAMSQRLIKQLCPHCRTPAALPKTVGEKLLQNDLPNTETVWTPKGCEKCNWDGYKGRIALADLAIDAHAGAEQSLEKAALKLLVSGDTSLQDIGALLK